MVIDKDLTIEMGYNNIPSVKIEASSKLYEYINFDVFNGTLNFNTTKRIRSKKRRRIKVS